MRSRNMPKDVEDQVRANGHSSVTFTASDLMAMELPPVRWVAPGFLPEGVILLAAPPKMGKSWMALGLAVAVASGGVALGTRRVERGEVLYLALEDNKRRLQTRLGLLLAGGVAPDGLHIALEWPRLDDGGAEKLERWLEEHPEARLVIIDTLKKIRERTNGHRGVYDVDYEALEPLVPIASAHGVAILVVHHTRKAGADDPFDTISGSTGLTGGADGAMVLKRERGRADAFLHVTGRDIEDDIELALRWDRETGGWIIAGDADEYRISQERKAIIDLLENADEPLAPKEIAEALSKTGVNVRMLLTKMVKDGQVRQASYGKYAIYSDYTGYTSEETVNGVTAVTDYPDEEVF